MKRTTKLIALAILFFSTAVGTARDKPDRPPSRYGYTLAFDAKTLPKGISVRTLKAGKLTRYFITNSSDVPLVINEKFQGDRLVSGAKLVSGKVYGYFPNGVPMAGKTHLKGWQAPFGEIKETLIYLPKDPDTIVRGRRPGLSKKLPPPEKSAINVRYDGKPYKIKVTIHYHLNPDYDK